MKLLLENWRKYLTEGMKTFEDLPEDIGITIRDEGSGIWEIFYSQLNSPEEYSNGPSGGVDMTKVADSYDCAIKDAWHLRSDIDHGWGPLIYDIAMEWASMHGSGLMSDRAGLSPHSQAVWQYYYDNRTDVKIQQLDDLKNTLTPQDDSDNCKQSYGITNSWYDLENSPTAKLYSKQPTTIAALRKLNKLIIIK